MMSMARFGSTPRVLSFSFLAWRRFAAALLFGLCIAADQTLTSLLRPNQNLFALPPAAMLRI
jgi:hypothetical protein